MAIPTKDSLLVPYSTNWNTRLNASPGDWGLVIGQATAYSALHTPYINAANALEQAREAGMRSEQLTADRNTARDALLAYARELYAFIQANTNVSDGNKALLGITVRDNTPTPVPVPALAPQLIVTSVTGKTAKIRLRDAQDTDKRAKPPGVKGANLFSFVGENPPTSSDQWKFEGAVTRTEFELALSDSVEAGTKVWVTANWFNPRNENGPMCDPTFFFTQLGGTTVVFGVMSLAA